MPRHVPYLIAGGIGIVLISIAGGVAFASQRPPYTIAAGAPVLVTTNQSATSLIEAHTTPSLAVDPVDNRHLVLAERIDRPRFGCRVHVSDDGGHSWSLAGVSLPSGKDNCFIPDVAFLGRTVYLVYLTLNDHPRDPLSGGNDPNGMYLARSDDGGGTFATPVKLPGNDNLQPRLAVDHNAGRLYIIYVKGSPLQNDTPLGFAPPPNPVMMISSTDGQTFADPVQVSDPKRLRVAAPTPVVAQNGTLFVLYQDYKGDVDDYNNWATPYKGTFAVVLARSTNEGKSFSQTVVDDQQVRPHRFLIYLPPFPSLAVTPDGNHLYAAWSDGRDGAPDVFLRRSDDAGSSWHPATKVNQRSGNGPANYELPALAAPGGNQVDIIYYMLSGSTPTNTVEFAYSTDGGDHFQARAAISRTFDARVGVASARDLGRVDWGDHLALVAISATEAVAAWSDSSHGTSDTERQDIVAAMVNLR